MKKRIFVLEDNEDLRELFTIIFQDENYEVTAFATVTAFREYKGALPDLYLLDIMLPDGDGLDICKEIKDDNLTTHIPVVLMSAHADAVETTQRTKSNGFVAKPFDVDHLTKYISIKLNARIY